MVLFENELLVISLKSAFVVVKGGQQLNLWHIHAYAYVHNNAYACIFINILKILISMVLSIRYLGFVFPLTMCPMDTWTYGMTFQVLLDTIWVKLNTDTLRQLLNILFG